MSTETKTPPKLKPPIAFVTSPPVPIEAICDQETAEAIEHFWLERYARRIAQEIKRRRKQKGVI